MPNSDLDIYHHRKSKAQESVAWWNVAPGEAYSILPLEIERLGCSPKAAQGPLSDPPCELKEGEHAYGFGADGRIRIRLSGTSFPDKCYETFVLDDGENTRIYRYSYSDHKPLQSETTVLYDQDGRVVEAITTNEQGEGTEKYIYEGERVTRIEFDKPGHGDERFQGAFVVEYDDGEIREIRQRYTNGHERVVYTRPEEIKLSRELSIVEDALHRAVPRVLTSVESDIGHAVAVALAYSFAGPPLPPLLGVVTKQERDALRAKFQEPWDWWNPAEYKHFDVPALDLYLSPSVRSACDRVNRSSAHEDVREMLNRAASRLNQLPWKSILGNPLVVYATDLEGTDVWENLASALPEERLQALEAEGLL